MERAHSVQMELCNRLYIVEYPNSQKQPFSTYTRKREIKSEL